MHRSERNVCADEMAGRSASLACMYVCLTVVAVAAMYIFFLWFVGIPVKRAVFEKTHPVAVGRMKNSAAMPSALLQTDPRSNTSSDAAKKSSAPLCEALSGTRYVNAYSAEKGTWASQEKVYRLDSDDRCKSLCSEHDPVCAGYVYDGPSRTCRIIPDGAEKVGNDGVAQMRGTSPAWVPCSQHKSRFP